MDRARKRFADNLAKLIDHNPDLSVLGDRKWIDDCTNDFIVHMSKKMWMHELADVEVVEINKAVSGYLKMRALVESSTPVESGNRLIKGVIVSMKQRCRTHELCGHHWYANVRTEDNNTIFTPLPPYSTRDLIGKEIEYFGFITVSARDKTFGFAHQVKLLNIKEESNAR